MIHFLILILAASCCAGIGYLKSAALSLRVEQLQTLQRMVMLLKGEISYAKTPLPDAFWNVGGRMEDPFRDFLRDMSDDMKRCDGRNFSEIFSENAECHFKESRLSGEDIAELKRFGQNLGYLDKDMQLANLEHYHMLLEQRIGELLGVLPQKKKLFQSLGVMGGLFLAILFW